MLHLYMFSVGCALDPHNDINVSYYAIVRNKIIKSCTCSVDDIAHIIKGPYMFISLCSYQYICYLYFVRMTATVHYKEV